MLCSRLDSKNMFDNHMCYHAITFFYYVGCMCGYYYYYFLEVYLFTVFGIKQ